MTPRLPTLFATMAASLALAGCHTVKSVMPSTLVPPNLRSSENNGDTLKQAQQRLDDATPCCTNYADFSYQNLLPWQPQKFVLGPGSSVANLAGTHSYFLAFRLPEGAKLPYRIAFKSALSGRWLKTSYLFAPTVVVLDDGFQPIGSSQDIDLCEYMGWSDETSGALGSYTITSAKARYLLVYSSATQQKGKTYWEQSPAAFNTNSKATLEMNSSGSFSVPHGPDGTLWMGMMDTTYAKAVDNAICKKAAKGDGVLNTLRTSLPALPWGGDASSKPADGKPTDSKPTAAAKGN